MSNSSPQVSSKPRISSFLLVIANLGCHRPAHLKPVRHSSPSPTPALSTSPPSSSLQARRPRHHRHRSHPRRLRRRLARHSKNRMRRQGQYGEADINSMVAAQLHHYQAQQRVPQHPDNSYPGRDSAQASGEHQYAAPKVRQSQWDRGGPNMPSQAPSYSYNEGQGAASAQSFYDGQRSDLKVGIEKQPSKESRDQSRIDRTETRYEDYNLPRTFEGLEQSFHEEIMMLSKELHDAEDTENSRHSERLKEINAQHQEKLLALRARQATYREEFLRKESLARQQQYQQASMSHYANNAMPGEQHGYHPAAVAAPPVAAGDAYGEAHRGYASAQYESFGDRPDYPEFRGGGRGRGHGSEHRSQYPGSRAYNSGGRRF